MQEGSESTRYTSYATSKPSVDTTPSNKRAGRRISQSINLNNLGQIKDYTDPEKQEIMNILGIE